MFLQRQEGQGETPTAQASHRRREAAVARAHPEYAGRQRNTF